MMFVAHFCISFTDEQLTQIVGLQVAQLYKDWGIEMTGALTRSTAAAAAGAPGAKATNAQVRLSGATVLEASH